MTIQGARDELINMMECKDIPFYFVPILHKVVETIEMEIAIVCDIEQIRAEIEQDMKNADAEAKKTQDDIDCGISIGLKMALDTVDKYTKGNLDG